MPDDPENVDFGEIDGAAALHLDGNYLQSALAAAKYARSKGVKVSLDAGGLYDGIEQLPAACRHFNTVVGICKGHYGQVGRGKRPARFTAALCARNTRGYRRQRGRILL